MNSIFYRSAFIPAEWISAHGFEPVRFIPEGVKLNGPVSATEGICPFMRAFVNEVVEAGGFPVVITTGCDQMRRGFEVLNHAAGGKAFLFNLPATWQGSTPGRLYLSELERLGLFLVSMGGRAPSREALIAVMVEKESDRGNPPSADNDGIPVALLGGEMSTRDRLIVDFIRDCGGNIVLDGTEAGERTRPSRFDPDRMKADPLKELAEAYFGSIPCSFRRPNIALYNWLRRMIEERKPRGIVFLRQVCCDLWHAEVQRARDEFKIPFLDIDLNSHDSDVRSRTRVEAFMESL